MKPWEKLEWELAKQHKLYRKAGVATIHKTEPGVKEVHGRRLIYASKGPPDFLGKINRLRLIFYGDRMAPPTGRCASMRSAQAVACST